jgi:hypothetical protein
LLRSGWCREQRFRRAPFCHQHTVQNFTKLIQVREWGIQHTYLNETHLRIGITKRTKPVSIFAMEPKGSSTIQQESHLPKPLTQNRVYNTSVPMLVGEHPHFGAQETPFLMGWWVPCSISGLDLPFPVLKGQGACPLHLQSLQHWNVPDMAKRIAVVPVLFQCVCHFQHIWQSSQIGINHAKRCGVLGDVLWCRVMLNWCYDCCVMLSVCPKRYPWLHDSITNSQTKIDCINECLGASNPLPQTLQLTRGRRSCSRSQRHSHRQQKRRRRIPWQTPSDCETRPVKCWYIWVVTCNML